MQASPEHAWHSAARAYAVGQHATAASICRDLLGRQPDHAPALHLLGMIAPGRGEVGLAIDCLTRSVPYSDTNPGKWNNLGVGHVAAGDHRAAVAAFERALQLQPTYAEVHNNLGFVLVSLGRPEEAIRSLQFALALRPAYAEALASWGEALKLQGRYAEALAKFDESLRCNPQYAEAVNGKGTVLHECGDFDQAEACYRQALALKPRFADASSNLASLLKERGALDQAVVQYRETFRLQPAHPLAAYNLSQFVADGRCAFEPEELTSIKAALAGDRLSDFNRSLLSFTMATVFDSEGHPDEAFEYYNEANALRRRFLERSGQGFDIRRQRALVDAIKAEFDTAYFEQVRGWGVASAVPIFIVGMPRSGTTLVEQILASHAAVHGAGEADVLDRYLAGPSGSAAISSASILASGPEAIRGIATDVLRRLGEMNPAAARVTTKPLNTYLQLGLLATLFPHARIVYCRRHVLDVCLSCYFQNFRDVSFAWSLEDIGLYYREFARLIDHWRRVLPLSIHEVRYENLVSRQESVTRDLLTFCGLPWDERCLTFFNNPRPVRTSSTVQVRKPIGTKAVGRWQRYCDHLAPLLRALAGEELRLREVPASPGFLATPRALDAG